jgi:hypothetical protein
MLTARLRRRITLYAAIVACISALFVRAVVILGVGFTHHRRPGLRATEILLHIDRQ